MEIIKSEKGFLTILTGKTGMGKSTITVYDASEFLKSGQSVMFFSYEYCQSIIVNKLVNHFGMSWSTLLRLNIVDAAGLNIHILEEMLRTKKDSVDAVYIDYLDLLKEATYAKANSDAEDKKQIQNIVSELATLAKELNIEYSEKVLIKIKDNKPQSEMKQDTRKNNVSGVYKVINKEKINNKKVLVVDDIFTTGSTADECARVLKDNNAESIGVFTLAKD